MNAINSSTPPPHPPSLPPSRVHQMATDDLVLLLVCCVLEVGRRSTDVLDLGDGHMPSFFSEMAFIKALHFCEDSTSAVYFTLSTFAVR